MLKALLIALLAAPAALAAEPAMLPLSPQGTAGPACTADGRWCVLLGEAEGDGPPLPVLRQGRPRGSAPARADDGFSVWPSLLPLGDGGFLAGVEASSSTGYSGGGGSATQLMLFLLSPQGVPGARPLLSLPVAGSLMIRACFSEQDMRRRRGACHDEYRFSARLTLAPGGGGDARPTLLYSTKASAFPRGVSRAGDSTDMAPLKQADLVFRRDARCSVTRRLVFDAAAGEYRPDRPLPDCSDYTVP